MFGVLQQRCAHAPAAPFRVDGEDLYLDDCASEVGALFGGMRLDEADRRTCIEHADEPRVRQSGEAPPRSARKVRKRDAAAASFKGVLQFAFGGAGRTGASRYRQRGRTFPRAQQSDLHLGISIVDICCLARPRLLRSWMHGQAPIAGEYGFGKLQPSATAKSDVRP
jgi:hypothetical protein